MTISVIIVDDERHAREALKHRLAQYPNVTIIAECENGLEAVKAVHECKPDVMFLDIHMPKLDGFDVLDLLGDAAPLTVLATAYDEYALQAFENNALDYLLKPIAEDRLRKTVERIETRMATLIDDSENITSESENLLQQHNQKNAPLNRILIREKGDVFVIPTDNISAIEAADDYVVIHTKEKNHIKQARLTNLEKLLDASQFCRIHRSSIINLDYLAGIETEGKDTKLAVLKTGEQFAISRTGYAKLIAVL